MEEKTEEVVEVLTGLAKRDSCLINMKDRPKEERIAIARKGGIASGESRRKRKTFKEALEIMLENEGLQLELLTSLLDRAKNEDNTGNKAFEVIRDTIGEKPTDKQETVNKNINGTIEDYLKKASDKDEY